MEKSSTRAARKRGSLEGGVQKEKYLKLKAFAIEHEKERHIPVPASTLKPAGIKRVEQKRPIQRMRDYSKYEKYSGITPGGDSGHEPRKEDWNDDIARNFQKELRKARSFRKRMGWDGIDRGALK